MLTKEHLAHQVENKEIDTVVVAFTDMQGRLMGKRVDAEYFVETSYEGESTEGCNYLLTVDMEMDPVQGYEMANWGSGYGDFEMVPDFNTLRVIPWLDATAMVLCDVAWHDGKPVRPSPQQVLRAQIERARKLGFEPMFGSELEFFLLKETYAEAHAKGYNDLTPSVPYILDYHVLATTYGEPFIRAVRKGMKAAGIGVESSKGEAWPGQQEINFRFADALTMADNHVIYKNGIKEMAHQHGCAVTFMAKPDHAWIGSSCHVHSSLWKDGRNAFDGESPVFKQYLAGHIGYASELAIFLAPNVNSYKRYATGSWAPTTLAWGHDNRTCGFRIVGHGQHLRTESRIPGADVNPYLCFAALLAAGLRGIEEKLQLPAEFKGNAYESDVQRFPGSLRDAFFFAADVSDPKSVQSMYAETVRRYGKVDILYNNAGIMPPDDDSILVTEPEAWDRVQAVNAKGVYLCCKYGIPHLLQACGGSVINVASFVAILGAATSQIAYTASKGAVLSMSRELAVQFARQGVRVTALCPGPVETPLLMRIFNEDPGAYQRRRVHLPMGRLAKAREIANAALFLASDESSYVNGATFMVDGGLTAAYVTPE